MYKVAPGVVTKTIPLQHSHTDSVSCAAFNLDCGLTEDLIKTPRLCATGAYDGAIVVYDPDTGNKLKDLEGPSDVEWLCFHPKGGSVS
jgi:ribosome assembly protein SQT1